MYVRIIFISLKHGNTFMNEKMYNPKAALYKNKFLLLLFLLQEELKKTFHLQTCALLAVLYI